MKILLLVLALIIPTTSFAAPRWELGKGFAIGIDTSLDIEGVGARDLKNGVWLTGMSKELFPIFKTDRKIAYIAGENLFIIDEEAKGSIGLAMGVPTGPVTEAGEALTRKLFPNAKLPNWVNSLSNWTSFEVGAGYRFLGSPEGLSKWAFTVGGRVRIPLDTLFATHKNEPE